jgi:ketosteroid isomerase-like protein
MIGTLMAKRAIAGAYDAMNRHDLSRFMAGWRDDGVFIYPGDIPESGTFQGKAAVEAWFRRFFEQFPEIQFEIQDMYARNAFDFVGNNVVAVHWNLRLTNRQGRAGENSGVSVVSIQGGKVVAVKDLLFDTGDEFRRNWGAA